MLSGAGREIEGLFEDDYGLTTDHHSDHQEEDGVNPMLAYVGRGKSKTGKSSKMIFSAGTSTTNARPSSKKSLDDLHQTAAMLVRGTNLTLSYINLTLVSRNSWGWVEG